jgi:hypothetical protein
VKAGYLGYTEEEEALAPTLRLFLSIRKIDMRETPRFWPYARQIIRTRDRVVIH